MGGDITSIEIYPNIRIPNTIANPQKILGIIGKVHVVPGPRLPVVFKNKAHIKVLRVGVHGVKGVRHPVYTRPGVHCRVGLARQNTEIANTQLRAQRHIALKV